MIVAVPLPHKLHVRFSVAAGEIHEPKDVDKFSKVRPRAVPGVAWARGNLRPRFLSRSSNLRTS